ncbi:hypothetical protein VNO77_20261 [Canavalia gladiata]|uniref:Uncharacterized protein n=1 Tax=Canavalia gladiata TaxID=3824 RepID=A0AAN9LP71_CANGL
MIHSNGKGTRKKLKEAIEDIDKSNEVEMKLAMTLSNIDLLQNELKLVKEMEKKVQGDGGMKQLEGSFMKREELKDSIMLQTIREELNKLNHATAEIDRLKMKEGKMDSIVQNLISKILGAKSKLEVVSSAEEKARSIISSLSHALEKLKTNIDEAKKENKHISQEVIMMKEEIQKIEFEIDMTKERLQGVMKELEVAKVSEALALERLQTLTETTMRERALTTHRSSLITISKFEYEYQTNHATVIEEIANKKVVAVEAWIEALKASEKAILMETKIT